MRSWRRWTFAIPISVSAFAFSSVASAAEAASARAKTFDDTLFIARGHLGMGTPVGSLGVSGELGALRYMALQLGVGSNGEGVQLALMGYGRLPLGDTLALDLGVGLSEGAYVHRTNVIDADHSDDTRWDAAVFANGEVALETLAKGGFSTRWSLGLGRLLNPDDVSKCWNGGDAEPCSASRRKAYTVPYIGVALGYAFSL